MEFPVLLFLAAIGGALFQVGSEVGAEYLAKAAFDENYGVSVEAVVQPIADPPPGSVRSTPSHAVLAGSLLAGSVIANDAPPLATMQVAALPGAFDADVPPYQLPSQEPTAEPAAAAIATPAAAEEPANAALLALAVDTPHRRADGSAFVPVATQRLFALRTTVTREEAVPATFQLPGQVVSDPNNSTHVQAIQEGRIEPAEGGMPVIGMKVEKGQLLGYLRPVLDVKQKAELDAKIAELTSQIALAEKRIQRLGEVYFVRYRESKIEAERLEQESLRKQLAILRPLLDTRVELRAYAAGHVSKVNVVAGQLVHDHDTLFEIVDSNRLWIEAAAFDPSVVGQIGDATAVTPDGHAVPLQYVGGGLVLQHQSVPLQFAMTGPAAGLSIGKPVTVIVKSAQKSIHGIRLPASAVSRGPDGQKAVWERVGAESFVARPVETVSLDGGSVVVQSGLSSGMRVVTDGTGLLRQVR